MAAARCRSRSGSSSRRSSLADPTSPGRPRPPGALNRGEETSRLETFSDGVFAIAATLLILDVRLPPGGGVTHGFLHIWPSYVAYALAFVTIGIMWINHHTVFRQIDRVDRTFLTINVVFLMVIAFVPFPTACWPSTSCTTRAQPRSPTA